MTELWLTPFKGSSPDFVRATSAQEKVVMLDEQIGK